MTRYAITFNLTADLNELRAEEFAAELTLEARRHLLAGERIELAGVEQAGATDA
jgi:hypothetical protein